METVCACVTGVCVWVGGHCVRTVSARGIVTWPCDGITVTFVVGVFLLFLIGLAGHLLALTVNCTDPIRQCIERFQKEKKKIPLYLIHSAMTGRQNFSTRLKLVRMAE